VYLTREEEKMLEGEYGEAAAKALRLIVRVGEALGAERLIKISHAHVSGISYDNIGEAGLTFIRDLYEGGGRASVFSTYNPAGVEAWGSRVIPVEPAFWRKQIEIIETLEAMGFQRSMTCIPYQLRRPNLGEHLAWGESSAVAIANTLYGARTNREGGPIALAAAITGRTYYWGLHLSENRKPSVVVELRGAPPLGELEAGILGYIVGESLEGKIAYIDAKMATVRSVQALCAAAAAAGSTAMCIVRGFSPEDEGPPVAAEDKITLSIKDIEAKRRDISSANLDEVEIFFTGCPHHDLDKIKDILRLLNIQGIKRLEKPIWVAVPGVYSSRLRDLAEKLAQRNVLLLPGTCLVVTRLGRLVKAVATDSVKTAFYLPRRHNVGVALASLKSFVRRYGLR